MEKEERRKRARSELLAEHGKTLQKLLGENFTDDPRFEQAVSEIAAGRAPQYVIMDLRGL